MKTVETMRVLKKKRRRDPPRFHKYMAIRYDKRSSTLGYDFISLANITAKRLKIPIRAHEYYDRYLGWDPRSIDLVYRNNRFFIHVVVQRADPQFISNGSIIGIDRG